METEDVNEEHQNLAKKLEETLQFEDDDKDRGEQNVEWSKYFQGVYHFDYPDICGVCGYIRRHHDGVFIAVKGHFTCLCLLHQYQVACCSKGFGNLITAIPHIVLRTPFPMWPASAYFNTKDGMMCITEFALSKFHNECIEHINIANYFCNESKK